MLGNVRIVAVVVLALAFAGCQAVSDDAGVAPTVTTTETPEPVVEVPSVPVGHAEISSNAVIWAQGSRIHVGKQTIDVAPLDVEEFVAARGGIYFTSHDQLWFTDLTRARQSGLSRIDDLTISANRRYLGLIDYVHGAKDRYGTPLATSVVYDLRTGDQVIHDATGMGSTRSDDLQDLYEDAGQAALGFDAANFYVATTGGTFAFPLDATKPHLAKKPKVLTPAGTEVGVSKKAGRYVINREIGVEPYSASLGPGERYADAITGNWEFRPFDPATGTPITVPGAPNWLVPGIWTSPTTIVGQALDADQAVADKPGGIFSCDLANKKCREVVPRTELGLNQSVVFGTGSSSEQ
jgi:hypothetical protein